MRVLYGILFLLLAAKGFAQDPHLSQYESTSQYLNPAMTGHFNGDHRFNIHYRTQWSAIAGNPFETSAISYDTHGKKINYGAFILNSRAGASSYNVLNVIFSGSYDLSLGSSGNHHLSTGLQAGLLQKSVNMSKLYWGSQYNNANGGSFDPNASSGENFSDASIILPELNAGLMYYFSKTSALVNPFVGFSVFHITEPKESFFDIENKLPRRYVTHGGAKFNISEKFQLGAYWLAMRQRNASEITTTLLGYYHLKGSNSFLLFGPTYRNDDAVIVHTGLKHGNLTYRVSYDINTSALRNITYGRGGFEFSVIYVMKKVEIPVILPCPRL